MNIWKILQDTQMVRSNTFIRSGYKQFDYYIEGQKGNKSRSRGKRDKRINYPDKSFVKAPQLVMSKKRIGIK